METPDLPFVHLKDFEPIPQEVLNIFPNGLVINNLIVPVAKRDGRLVAAVPKTHGLVKPAGLKLLAGCPVDLVLAPIDEIEAFIKSHYLSPDSAAVAAAPPPDAAPIEESSPSALKKLVWNVVHCHATEVLMDIKGENLRVRHRIRGVLVKPEAGIVWTRAEADELLQTVRDSGDVHAVEGIRWTENRLSFSLNGKTYDCVFSLSETATMTLLTARVNPMQEKLFDLQGWGMDPVQSKTFEALISRNQGVVLFCGADQDGAGATLNSCVRKLIHPGKHVVCVESYVDQWISEADQFNAKGDPALFAHYLRTALSHSPDVLKVRPLDNKEAWDVCLREALRGPLVLGGGYARDTAEAVVNIVRMGVDPFLVTSGLLGVVTQRRLRLNCQHCQQQEQVSRDRLKEIGIPIELQPSGFYSGAGCEQCNQTGFGNETHIFEVLVMNDEIKNTLHKDVSADKIRHAAKLSGLQTLRQVAIHKAIAGQTSLAEVARISPK